MRKILPIVLIILLFFTSVIHAATYYVSTTGSNGDPGTEAQPWATLAYAASTITNSDTVIVRGGTYQSGCTIRKSNVTFQNYPSETPIIDGDGVRPGPEGGWGTLIMVQASGADLANSVTLDGFEIRESSGYALQVDGRNGGTDNVIIKNCQMIENYRMGIVIGNNADNALIEDCEIHNNCNCMVGGMGGTLPICTGGTRPPQISTKNCNAPTFRRCKVYDSYHEGFNIDDDTTNAVVEYCEIYGNPQLQLYLVCSDSATVRYNLIYGTSHGTGAGIWTANELAFFDNSPGDPYYGEHTIYGNLVANTSSNIWIGGGSSTPIRNMTIYNNTLVEATGTGFRVESGTGDGHIFKNNIVWQTNDTIAQVPSGKVTSDYNLWSRTPDVDVQGTNDPSYAAPLLIKTSGWQAGTGLTGNDFTLQDSSPAINIGVNLGSPYNLELNPASTWPDNVSTLDQDSYGLWEIGGFVYTGTILPVVTTQAVTDITTTTAIGHGIITDVGGESNCTKRGICWNTTGSPTVANDKVEEVGDFPAGAFSGNMTGLTPDQAYFSRAYGYNTGGYGYSSTTEGYNTDADANGTYIIDDGDAETSSTGTWSASGGANPYGTSSLYSHEVNATYTYEKTLDGNYTVSLWWTEYASRSSSVTVKIYDSGDNLLDTKSVNQTTLGGQWNVQDTYDFNATAKVVILSTGGGPPNVSTCADAVKFDYVEGSGGEDVNNPSILHGIVLQGCEPG